MNHIDARETPVTALGVETNFARTLEAGLYCRAEEAADLEFLRDLYRSTRAEEVAQSGWPEAMQIDFLNQQFDAQFKHYLEHYPDADRWIIMNGNSPIGRLYLEEWPTQFRIIDIALISKARGKGFGSALLKDTRDLAFGNDKAVSIHVEKNNPAIELYRRLGFEKTEDKGVYDLMTCSP